MTRPSALADGDYDVVVIGGGMAGAGVARDLALRGVSVALVEKGDFAGATTSRSSKLIHGGLRYLELFDVALVRESLRERETLNRLAPHLVRPLPFLVPIYRDSSRGLIKVRIGLTLYDWLTPGRDRERYRVLPPIDTLSLEPAIRAEDLRGAGYYFDDLSSRPSIGWRRTWSGRSRSWCRSTVTRRAASSRCGSASRSTTGSRRVGTASGTACSPRSTR